MTYSILINTCDKFEDCWNPFFKLWANYWNNCTGKVYLNTEYKDYSYPNLDIISVKGCERNNISKSKKATWSQCLRWALETIDTDVVLYMQEDYFLKDFVKNEIVEEYVRLMYNDENVHCIHLTDQGVPNGENSNIKSLHYVPRKHRDRVSCQAALWRKDILLQYIRDYESGWNFEWWGSKRAALLNHNFFVVNREWVKLNEFEIIPYLFTGVVGGRWIPEVQPLFEKHNIQIDYNYRGFVQSVHLSIFQRIQRKAQRLPIEFRGMFELLKLRMLSQ